MTDGHRLETCPISLHISQTGGIHGLDTSTLLISPDWNCTLTASGSGFLGSMIVKTFATSRFVLLQSWDVRTLALPRDQLSFPSRLH